MKMPREYKRYALGIRIAALTLYDVGIPLPIICHKYGCTPTSVYRWARIARKRGWDPKRNPIITIEHLEDAPRSGRPTLQTWERTRELIREVTGSKKGYQSLYSRVLFHIIKKALFISRNAKRQLKRRQH